MGNTQHKKRDRIEPGTAKPGAQHQRQNTNHQADRAGHGGTPNHYSAAGGVGGPTPEAGAQGAGQTAGEQKDTQHPADIGFLLGEHHEIGRRESRTQKQCTSDDKMPEGRIVP